MRTRAAVALVAWADRWWSATYDAHCRKERGEVPDWWDKPWAAGARRVTRFAIPLAMRLDSHAAAQRMALAGWWG